MTTDIIKLAQNHGAVLDVLDLLGTDRMIRRAYEKATSNRPAMTKAWHEAEVRAAAVRAEERERIAAWIASQRNDIPATGEEFAAAIRAMKE